MTQATNELAAQVRERLKELSPGPGAVTGAADDALSHLLAPLLRAAKSDTAGASIEEAMQGIVDASKDVSPLWHLARGAVLGVMRAAQGSDSPPWPLIEIASRKLVSAADAVDADFGAAAKGAVEGAILAAEAFGFDQELAASTAATSAWRTAGARSAAAAERIRHVVTPQVMGIPTRLLTAD